MNRILEGGGFSSGFRGLGISFRIVGWISFWLKLVLGVIAGILVPFALSASSLIRSRPRGLGSNQVVDTSNPLNGFGLLIIIVAIVFLLASVIWSFWYTRFSRRFMGSKATYPSKGETIRLVKLALLTDLLGMLIAVVGGEWIVGITLGEVIALSGGGLLAGRSVQPELFMIQACINTMAGQFVGIASSLWLLQRITYVRPQQ